MIKSKGKQIKSKIDNNKMAFPVGRPPKYKTVEDMEKKFIEYFDVTNIEDYTVTGLSIYLGFNSRQSLLNYQGTTEFVDTIKKAKQLIEHSYEIDLKKKGNSGTIFALKNFDWKDKTEVDNNISGSLSLTDLHKKL